MGANPGSPTVKLDRKFFLKVMIAALLFTGASGIFAVLTGTWHVVGKVMLSACVAAVTAGMMMPIAGWVDDEDTRPSGLWGIALIILQTICFLAAIWVDYSNAEWRFLATGFILFPLGWPAIWIIAAKGNKPFTLANLTSLGTLALSSLAFITGIWWQNFFTNTSTLGVHKDIDWNLIASACTLYFYGILAAIALADWTRHDKHHWRWVGPVGALISTVLILVGIWAGSQKRTPILDVSTALALFAAHAMFIIGLQLGPNPTNRFFRLGTILIAGITIAMACAISIASIDARIADAPLVRLTGAGTILTICCTLALIIIARLNRGVNLTAQDANVMDALIDLFCPRCKTRQSLSAGDSACHSCGLRISIKIEEPRCSGCGYLLYKIPGNTCPDCGKPINTPALEA